MKNRALLGYNKIAIIGSVASGKTTLARKIAEQRQSFFFELDNLVHIRRLIGDIRRTQREIDALLERLYKFEAWIVEGVYRESYAGLFDRADCILLMDTPIDVREKRIYTRWVKQYYGYESAHYLVTTDMLKCMIQWNHAFDEGYEHLMQILKPYEHKLIRYSQI